MNFLKTGIIFLAICLSLSISLLASSKKLIEEKTFNVSPGELLYIESDGGDVEITSWDRNEVEIKIYGNSKAEKYFEFDFEQNSKGIFVDAESESNFWSNIFSSISLRFEVRVPKKFDTEIKTAGGDLSLSSTIGNINLRTSGGDVHINNCQGEIEAKTSGGDIKMQECQGNVSAGTSGGDIKCLELEGDISASTSGGDIHAEVSNGKIDLGTSGGDIVINYYGNNQGIRASTSGGDVKLTLDSDVKAELKLYTTGGDVNYNFKNLTADEITSSKLLGSINGGGKLIKCSTTGGDITFRSR